ncbi:MAG: DinB family protein [Planctomycetota bacterium]|nr:DinB family protein [Planctomycetota bacterium]
MQAKIVRPADVLMRSVEGAVPDLLAIMEWDASEAPEQGAWSPKQVLGHLVDLATAHHQRFVQSQLQDDLVFPSYEHEDWVVVQRYNEAPWAELVELWRQLNGHLAHIFRTMPEEDVHVVYTSHNLHKIAFRPVEKSAPVTLHWLQEDYVLHVQHHLGGIAGVD